MPNSPHKIILGIDPGLATSGYGIITQNNKEPRCLTAGVISTSPDDLFPQRLLNIYQTLVKLIRQYKPTAVAVEELFFAKNVKTALVVGQARGVIILAAERCRLPIYEYTPLQIKQALTGYGRASKTQMQKMVALILKLKEIPQPDDAADALAIALCCGQTNHQLHG